MYVCMYVCMCMYACIYENIYIYIYLYIYIYIYIYVCMYVCIYVYVCVYVCMCIYVRMCICIYIYKLSLISVLCDGSSAVLSQGSETLQLSRAFKGCSRPIYIFFRQVGGIEMILPFFFFSFRKCFVA